MSAAPDAPDGDTPLTCALRYAAAGIRVLPIKPGQKRPPMTSWQFAATTDPKVIANWYRGLYGKHGVGLASHDAALKAWPALCGQWLKLREFGRGA